MTSFMAALGRGSESMEAVLHARVEERRYCTSPVEERNEDPAGWQKVEDGQEEEPVLLAGRVVLADPPRLRRG